jgi:predicted ATPase/DNA-binding SARP family transcriptional activator
VDTAAQPPAALRLRLLGAPALEHAGAWVSLPFERRHQLLALLALRGGWVPRADVAALLWPEHDGPLAYANLRKALFRLQALPWGGAVESQAAVLRLQARTDVADFEQALAEQRLADAVQLGRDELLAGFDDAQSDAWSAWLGRERDRLRTAWRAAALKLLATPDDAAAAIELSARLLDADPLDEAALRAHVQALARDGQVAAARQAWRRFAQRLQDELGLAPGAELQALHDTLGAPVPPPASAAPTPSAPPILDEGFVGRTVELHRMAALLSQDDCRLLTLVGPGGVGKTRLARRAMQELGPGFSDGAVFVPLDDATAVSDIGARLARETGGARAPGDPLDAAIAWLQPRHLLIVLDNFEQLAADASVLTRVLQACPRVRLIVTSRVRLNLPGEWALPLEGLPCPDPEDADRLEAFDAVRLFVRAARRVQPAYAPGADGAALVDICRQVDGLPLALELAAAWVRVLPCDAIAAELRHGTELLRAVDAGQPARHASIDVVFDQSWRRLAPAERDVLAKLSVFRDGFTAEAARAVATAPLPVLGALADKSLLRRDEARLHLHPLVQQLAAARFADEAARDAAERAHARHFLGLMAQLRRGVEGGARDALQRVDQEFENCRAAWRWTVAHGDVDALGDAATTLLHFCDHRGRLQEGLALLQEAVDAPAVQSRPALHMLLMAEAAHLAYRLDRYADAEAMARRALAACKLPRDHAASLQCHKVLGGCGLRLGRPLESKRHFEQALKLAPASVDPRNAAAMLDNIALVEKASGRYDEALKLSLESLLQHRRLGDAAGEALCLNNLSDLYMIRGDFAAAGVHLREALALCEKHGINSTRTLVHANLGEVAIGLGDTATAQLHTQRALELAETAGNRAIASRMRQQLVQVALQRSDLGGAREHLAASLATALSIGRTSLQLTGVACFAELLAAQREPACARQVIDFALSQPGLSAPDRDALRERARAWADATSPRAWPGWTLDELAHRIVVESAIAHEALIAALRRNAGMSGGAATSSQAGV